jgi:hypothetical protein
MWMQMQMQMQMWMQMWMPMQTWMLNVGEMGGGDGGRCEEMRPAAVRMRS